MADDLHIPPPAGPIDLTCPVCKVEPSKAEPTTRKSCSRWNCPNRRILTAGIPDGLQTGGRVWTGVTT